MKRNPKKLLTWLLLCSLLLGNLSFLPAQAKEKEDKAVHLDASEYGIDPTGEKDSTEAVQKALAAAKKEEEKGQKVVLEFPRGEYQIYKDKAEVRNYHTSNTNSLEHPQKTIGILIEEHKNLTIDGNGSLFMMHGNMMALAVVKSENIKLKNFSWDFEVPTVSEMTITNMVRTTPISTSQTVSRISLREILLNGPVKRVLTPTSITGQSLTFTVPMPLLHILQGKR